MIRFRPFDAGTGSSGSVTGTPARRVTGKTQVFLFTEQGVARMDEPVGGRLRNDERSRDGPILALFGPAGATRSLHRRPCSHADLLPASSCQSWREPRSILLVKLVP